MMSLRRLAAVLLALIFIIVFIPMLVVFRVNDTAGNPHFYTAQLRQADTYNYLYDDILPQAVNEATADMDSSADIVFSTMQPYLVPMIEDTFPRPWLQTQVELVIDSVIPYAMGDIDSFRIEIPIKDRLEAGAQSFKDTLHEDGVFTDLYNQALDKMLADKVASLKDLPLTEEQLKTLLKNALTPEWAQTQFDEAVDAVVPYLTGDSQHFTIRLNIAGQVSALETATNELLQGEESYNYFLKNVMVPAIKQEIQSVTVLSAGIVFSDSEIEQLTEETFPLEWYQSRIPSITSPIFAYLEGNNTTLDLSLSIADRKPVAVQALSKLVNQKVGTDVSVISLPIINGLVEDFFSNDISLNDTLLGSDGEEALSEAKELISQGYTFTDADLQESLGPDFDTVESIRQQIVGGFVLTEEDLRNLVIKDGNNSDYAQWQSIENARSSIGTLRKWRILGWLIPALLLLAIGALGARRWYYKIIWGASVLAVASGLVYILVGPIFSATLQPQLTSSLLQAASETRGIQSLMAEKGVALVLNAIDSFIGGLKLQALILLVISALVIAFGIIWPRTKYGKRPPAE